ncbi:MAG: carboxypeptidase regulatory-like domain-containing protein [Candidatus Saganbacteria bacterium]|nr:carboxypeptidase regulatory-like domain-containing protein [Candidatus Saganbacteria bacterium]
MKKILSLLFIGSLLLSGCGETVISNATVTGFVTDTSAAAIPGATVTIAGVSGTTGSSGSYNLTGVKTGLQTISASAAGYISQTKQINVGALETNYAPAMVLSKKDGKSTDVGSGGGDVTNADGTVKITIPENALKSTQIITVTKCDLSAAPAPPSGYKFIYLVYITPVDISLEKKVTLRIPLLTEVASDVTVPFFRFDTSTLSWVAIDSGSIDAVSSTISVGLSNFGWIAAARSLGTGYGTVNGRVVSSSGPVIVGANVWYSSNITVSDPSGNYTLSNMPEGTLTINAYAAGYNANTASVTVKAGSLVYAPDIVLSPTAPLYGTITGQVISSSTSAGISGARITVSGKTAYTDSSGLFTVTDISPGSVSVTVYANGYLKKTSSATVTAGAGTTLNFSIDVTTVSTFFDDFETDKEWVKSISYVYSPKCLWNRTANSAAVKDIYAPVYVTLPDYEKNGGAIPLAYSGSYSYWFGEADKGSFMGEQLTVPPDTALSGGTSAARYQGDLTSPTISLAGYESGKLSFWTWWEVESMHCASGFDVMKIMISTDGGANWSDLATLNPVIDQAGKQEYLPYSSGGFNKEGVWVKHELDLTPYVGNDVQIRFSFDAKDNKYNGFRGWFIDDVSVTAERMSTAVRK